MLERQDIDALLIGSLYGELSSTEEARLTAHLDSHPADRTALADLTRARTIVRESRILQVEFDPPQSITALLMQEAVRRAPKAADAPSWFQRFLKSFMLHPAMAAAAMLVLIIGVASTMYSRKGDQYAGQTKDDSSKPASLNFETDNRPGASPANEDEGAKFDRLEKSNLKQELQANGPVGSTGSAALARDNFRVSLDDGVAANGDAESQRGSEGKGKDAQLEAGRLRDAPTKEGEQVGFKDKAGTPSPPKVAKKAPSRRFLEVTTDDKAPKDLAPTTTQPAPVVTGGVRFGGDSDAGKTSRAGNGSTATVARPPIEEPTPTADQRSVSDRSRAPEAATVPAPAPPPAQVAHEEKLRADGELAWAKAQHSKAITQVKAGNCTNAANIAVAISNRVPGYYAQNVESDRTIKPCITYINAQREREADRAQRQKAAQRRAVDEQPPKAAPNTTTK